MFLLASVCVLMLASNRVAGILAPYSEICATIEAQWSSNEVREMTDSPIDNYNRFSEIFLKLLT